MTTKAKMTVSAVCAGILAFATSAVAGPRTLPTPSNAVTVAFGTDADNDGDLAPEETDLRVG